jgi:hypothetical protein
LNKATPMDGYPMHVADLLIDAAAWHKVISFMDGNAGYNQIFMAIEDISKTAFRCPGHIGLFEWIVMTFGLKKCQCNLSASHELHLSRVDRQSCRNLHWWCRDQIPKSWHTFGRFEKDLGVHPKAWFKDESKQMLFWGISWRILVIFGPRRGNWGRQEEHEGHWWSYPSN